jgi:hypothetical protein
MNKNSILFDILESFIKNLFKKNKNMNDKIDKPVDTSEIKEYVSIHVPEKGTTKKPKPDVSSEIKKIED